MSGCGADGCVDAEVFSRKVPACIEVGPAGYDFRFG
jgi:hypothetical protein